MSELKVNKVVFGDNSSQWTAADRSFRNKIINGDMSVDQEFEGASTSVPTGQLKYILDQWYAYCTGAAITGQQVVGTIANTFRCRLTGAASNTGAWFGQRMEAVNTAHLAGSTITLQALLSSVGLTQVTWTLYYANTKDTFGTVASPTRTQIATGNFTIDTEETKYDAQIDIPAAATTGLELIISCGSLLAGQTLTIGDVQLEKAGAPSEFERVPYDESLRRCQRYWHYIFNVKYIIATAASQDVYFSFSFNVMRSTPIVTKSGGSLTNCTDPGSLSVTPKRISGYFRSGAAGPLYGAYTYTLNARL